MFSKNFVSLFTHSVELEEVFKLKKLKIENTHIKIDNHKIISINNILSNEEIDMLLEQFNNNNKVKVGIDGIVSNYIEGTIWHSKRSTMFSENIANSLFERIKSVLTNLNSPYKTHKGVYEPIGINPSFRFIEYNKDGLLVPHYDFPYIKDDNTLTLQSLVLYLTNDSTGSTRFIKEYRENDFSDLTNLSDDNDVLFESKAIRGKGLLFPHNILHESKMSKNKKIIIRTDVIYKRIK